MAFTEDDIPSLNGKVVIVTGGNSGIGKQTVAVLASKGAKVYSTARSKQNFDNALEHIKVSHPAALTNGEIRFLHLDYNSAKHAKAAAEDFLAQESSLDILFNNAGVAGSDKGSKSEDGYELQWATNTFGPFVFTHHLLPTLLKTPGARIVNVASDGAGQCPKSGIPLHDPTVGAGASHFACYGHSKLGTILITRQLAKRHPEILSFAPHPGPVQSELTRNMGIPKPVKWILDRVLFKPVAYGALTQLYAGTSTDTALGQNNGAYLVPLAKIEKKLPHALASDDHLGEEVWKWCEDNMMKVGAD